MQPLCRLPRPYRAASLTVWLRTLPCLAEERTVVPIVLADEFVDPLQIGPQAERARDRIRLFKYIRIVNREFVTQRVERAPGEFLHHVQALGVPEALQFGLVVEADGIDDERVAFPMSNRVAKPARIGIDWMRTSVCRDDAERARVFMKDGDVAQSLQHLKLIRHAPRLRRHQRQAVGRRAGVFASADDAEFLSACLQRRPGRRCGGASGGASARSASSAEAK